MRVRGDHWVDEAGRRLILRGANLGGDCKVPVRPDGDTKNKQGFYDRRGVSFVGRPFPLEEADEHFTRLERWGFGFLRFLTTWEAVEHDGPGIYDEAYLDYLEAIVAKAGEHGISLFIDPHQDVWSRWTGGDGAPIWALEAVGFAPERLHASGAAILNQELGDAYPRMIWMSNYDRLACATMWTLFFAGDDYAPDIGPVGPSPVGPGAGGSLQDFLQGHYIAAMAKVASRVAKYPNVVGFDSLNEPSAGFIGVGSVHRRGSGTSMGVTPTPWESILAGEGIPQKVEVLGIKGLSRGKVGEAALGVEGLRAWADGVDSVWQRAGLYSMEGGKPVLKDPAFFAAKPGKDFTESYLKPFIARYEKAIRGALEEAVSGDSQDARRFALFVEGVPNAGRPRWTASDPSPAVDATHWYDDLTLVTKKWRGFVAYDARHDRPVLGFGRVRRYFAEALLELKAWSAREMGGIPTLLGEFGIPFDMNGAKAYRTGDYSLQEKALAANYDAVDASLIDSTIWNYSAGNRHEHGELWNGEDLSIFCRDEREAGRSETGDPADSGGRALRGFVRPYARATSGEVLSMAFQTRRGVFSLRYRPDPAISAPTEIFVPELQYPDGFIYEVEGGEAEVRRGCLLVSAHLGAKEVNVRITRK
jgi:hypothetical protein